VDAIAAAAALAPLDASMLDVLVARLHAVAHLLRDLAAATGRASPLGWSGAGRQAYDAAVARVMVVLVGYAGALEVAGLGLSALAVTLHSVQTEAAQARRIMATGTADALTPIDSQLSYAVQAFDDADRRAAMLLFDALLGLPLTRQAGVEFPLASRAALLVGDTTRPRRLPDDPVAVSLWWAGMPAQARSALSATPWVSGQNLAERDGMPVSYRDATNRALLAQALRSAERSYSAAMHGIVPGLIAGLQVFSQELPWPLSWIGRHIDPGAGRAKKRVEALRQLTRDLERPGSELLEFDAKGDGRAVVASGDVETSRSVAVLVPGMSTELEDVPKLIGESSALVKAAGAGNVVVAWLGYDAPSVFQVAGDGKAKAGARELSSFVRGVRATASLRQRVTVIGHSYGTLVAGLAAKRAPIADDLVLLASPGVEASSAAQLRVPAGHVWAVRATTDPIQVVFWPAILSQLIGLPAPLVFGPDPASDAFGAAHFGVGGAHGHSGYFKDGSQSLDNLGRIVSGRPTR
jgi:uncharacterized protein YukE